MQTYCRDKTPGCERGNLLGKAEAKRVPRTYCLTRLRRSPRGPRSYRNSHDMTERLLFMAGSDGFKSLAGPIGVESLVATRVETGFRR